MTCQRCSLPTVGNSKYCAQHKREARAAFIAMIETQKAERAERDARFAELHLQAHRAGVEAGEAAVPTPMVVVDRANPFDRNSAVQTVWEVPDGPCGYAWVTIRPGRCAYANWAKANAGARKGYHGGVEIFVHQFNQSVIRKSAYARAYAQVLSDAGIEAYSGSRED